MARPFESRIQDLVYNVEVGVGLRIIKIFLYIIFVSVVMILYMATQFKGFGSADAMEYSQLGRKIQEGKGFSTFCIRPISMWYLIENADNPDEPLKHHTPHMKSVAHPDILHAPMYPLFLSGFYTATKTDFSPRMAGQKYAPEQYIVIANAVLAAITGFFVFLLARRLFDQRVAVVGGTMYFLSDMIWADAISGLPISLAMLFGVLAFYSATVAVTNRQEGYHPLRWIVPLIFCAAFLSALFHTRYAAVVFVPGIMIYIGFGLRRQGWLWAFIVLALFILSTLPWMMRNKEVSGGYFGLTPYLALEGTALFPNDKLDRTFAPDFDDEKTGDKITSALRTKFLTTFPEYFKSSARGLGDGILICLFIVTFFYRFSRPHVRVLRWAVALSFFLLLISAGFYGDDVIRLAHIFWPIAILYGTAFFFLMLDRLQFRVQILNLGTTVLFVMLNTVPLIFTLLPPQPGVHYPPYSPEFIFHLTDMLKDNEMLSTDMPWATSWYGNQRSVMLPQTLDDFYDINDYTHRISALYFTPLSRNKKYISQLKTGPDRSWFPIHEGQIPADFPLKHGFPLMNYEQLFLTDGPRWEK